MDIKEQVYRVLLVSSSLKFNNSIKKLLPEAQYHPINVVHNVGAAKRELLERTYDIVLINTPLPDDFGTTLAIDLCNNSGVGVLLFVKNDYYEQIYAKVTAHGVLTLSKPTSMQVVTQSLMLLCGTRERLRRIEKKAASIEEKMTEIRLINRAKWILIEELKMTEAMAHRYIEKQAMDRCVTRLKIAEAIIQTYK